ncbi:MAG: 1-acyl-sn-glycerol-3-phosphate acyltransferase [Micrococcales bacterium]|nr:1-acyl-sn-glycerol-3-phosphate acyltransferase [Micrococcales bacterium]
MPPVRPRPARSNRTYRSIAHILRPALRAMTRTTWSGAEHLPTDRGFVVATNHVTNLDPLTVAHFLWDHGFAPRIMAKHSLFGVPVLGRVLRGIEAIPVHRGTAAGARSLDAAAAALERGECVLVFPEGTLTGDPDLWPMLGKTGAARLALDTGAPLVPVAQWGAHRVLAPRGKVLKAVPRRPVGVIAGPPVDLDDLHETRGAAQTATTRLMAQITDQLAQIRDEQPPDGVWDPRTRSRVVR